MIRGVNKRILVLCEGTTEYLYARTLQASLSRVRQRMITIEIIQHKQNDPLSLVKEAKKKVIKAQRERNAYDSVWLFFDHDNSPHLGEAFQICEQENFNLAYTAISLEFWFLLHLEDNGRAFVNGKECLRALLRLWPEYHKTKLNHYKLLKDNLAVAKKRARRLYDRMQSEDLLHRNPYTTVHLMVDYFESLDVN